MFLDDASIADYLHRKVRVLCWIMTCPKRLSSRAKTVKDTWGQRCDTLLFASDIYDQSFPTINISVLSGRTHLVDKTVMAFDYIYHHHLDDADWFLKADDDTYVVMENLRYFLSGQNHSQTLFFGSHFLLGSKSGMMSGGAGYVVSRETLKIWGKRPKGLCFKNMGPEDIEWSRCMNNLGVTFCNSRDNKNRTRFHSLNPNALIQGGYSPFVLRQKWGMKPVCLLYMHYYFIDKCSTLPAM